MSENAIICENLGKRYRLGQSPSYVRLSEVVVNLASAPFRALRRAGGRPSEAHIWALRNVSFSIGRGEVVGIIGRNGAGKSTLLKILSRITEPTEGEVRINGRVGSLLEVGTGFHPELTGRENIFLNGAILGMKRAEIASKFDEIVAFAETERFLDTPVKHYSSGMYMRLAFAVAAHLEPEILVVDEVLAVGDAAFQTKCLGKMSSVASEGRTVVFVSHNMQVVSNLCGSAILFEAGQCHGKTDVESAILGYTRLFRDEETFAPIDRGDFVFQELVVHQDGFILAEYDGGKPISIRLRFELRRHLRDFRIGVFIRTPQGTVLARTLLADWDPSLSRVDRGAYTLEGTLPAGLLGGGNYVIAPHASIFDLVDYEIEEHSSKEIRVRPTSDFNQAYPRERGSNLMGLVTLNPGWRLLCDSHDGIANDLRHHAES